MDRKLILLGAAVAGMIAAGSTASAGEKGKKKGKEKAEQVKCYGANSCGGHGACGMPGGNDCKGKNACKGKGWNMMSKADCEKAGGSTEAPKPEGA
jgi:hypothetical protein